MHGTQVRLADREVDAIVREAFGERRLGITHSVMAHGVINDTRMLTLPDGTRRILRVAPSDAFAAAGPTWLTPFGLRREAAVIAAAHDLAGYLPVTIAHDFRRQVIDRDWVIQEFMPGEVLRSVDPRLPPQERAALWAEIGEFTRRLHTVTSDGFGPPAWGPRFDTWPALLAWDVAGMREDAARFGYDESPFARLEAAITDHHDLLGEVTTPGLIHSDLNRYHLFVERREGQWRLRGTIDLEFGRFADPLSESLLVGFEWDNAPIEMRDAFLQGYAVNGLMADQRRRVGIYAALALAWFAPLLAMQGEPLDDLMSRMGRSLDALEE